MYQYVPNPLALFFINAFSSNHTFDAKHQSHSNINRPRFSHWIQSWDDFRKAQLFDCCGDASLNLILHELWCCDWLLDDGKDDILGKLIHSLVKLSHHFVQAHQSKLCDSRTEVTEVLKKLIYDERNILFRQQLSMKLHHRSDLRDAVELNTPVWVFHINNRSF